MKQYLLPILASFCLLFTACGDEENLSPTERPESGYFVPQGNNDYDDRIVKWKEDANFFILYKFEDKDIRWRYSAWADTSEVKYTLADANYINRQLDLIEQNFLNFYSVDLLREGMPLKLLLLGYLDDNMNYTHRRNIYSNFDSYAIAWGDQSIETMTAAEKRKFKTEVNQAFLFRLVDKGIVQIPEAFSSVSVYDDEYYYRKDMYKLGFLGLNQAANPTRDFKKYIEVIIGNPKSYLESPSSNYSTHEGILDPGKDENGLIKRKYNALIDYFTSLGIDLQGIGDKQ